MSKDSNQNDKMPDNIVRVDFGRGRASTSEDKPSENVSESAAETPVTLGDSLKKQAQAEVPSTKSEGGVLSFGDPRIHERLRMFSEWIAGSKVMLVIDATRDDVLVPEQFKNNAELKLDFSLRFGISDFVYDRSSVRCTLSFGGKEFYCVIPWAGILMMYAHETGAVVFFDEDLSEPFEEVKGPEDSDGSDDEN